MNQDLTSSKNVKVFFFLHLNGIKYKPQLYKISYHFYENLSGKQV